MAKTKAKAIGKTDANLVQEAYEGAVRQQVDTYFNNCIVQTPDPDGKFLRGLKTIREARDRAIDLVNR